VVGTWARSILGRNGGRGRNRRYRRERNRITALLPWLLWLLRTTASPAVSTRVERLRLGECLLLRVCRSFAKHSPLMLLAHFVGDARLRQHHSRILVVEANRNQRFAEAFWFWRTSVSVRSNRYLLGSWFADRLMAVLWAYLVVRGFGRRRGSAQR